VRIYELLIQFKGSYVKFISVDDLRKILQLEKEYTAFKDFRIYVLDIAVEQINKHTDMKVKYELAKTGRKYTDITFKFVIQKEKTTVITEKLKLTDKQILMYAVKLSKHSKFIKEYAHIGESEKSFFKRILDLLEDLELNEHLIPFLFELGYKPKKTASF
jgi:plasmid replication initiation protein